MENNVIQIMYENKKFLVSYKDLNFYFDKEGKIDKDSDINFLKFILSLDFSIPLKTKSVRFENEEEDKKLDINNKINVIKIWLDCLNEGIKDRSQSDGNMEQKVKKEEISELQSEV